MSTAVDYRQVSAKYYDEAYATKEDLEDLEFYVDMAKANGGRCWNWHAVQGEFCCPLPAKGFPFTA